MCKNKKIVFTALCVISLFTLLLTVTPRTQAQLFIVAGWDYPDDHGQGMGSWYAQSNATGSWVTIETKGYAEADAEPIRWNVSQAIRILVWVWVNSTFLGLSDLAEGLNYIRHNITITNQFSEVIFSQQNFTVFDNSTLLDPIWGYRHYVIPDFSPLEAEFYTITLLCEIYY